MYFCRITGSLGKSGFISITAYCIRKLRKNFISFQLYIKTIRTLFYLEKSILQSDKFQLFTTLKKNCFRTKTAKKNSCIHWCLFSAHRVPIGKTVCYKIFNMSHFATDLTPSLSIFCHNYDIIMLTLCHSFVWRLSANLKSFSSLIHTCT